MVGAVLRNPREVMGLTVALDAERAGVDPELPVDKLREPLLDGDDSGKVLFVEDMLRVAVAIGATARFAEWFGEPEVVACF
jgi:hypothetical protein